MIMIIVSDLFHFIRQNIMHLPSDVLHSLQIFNSNTHLNMHQKKGKESTSLFSKYPLLNRDFLSLPFHFSLSFFM